MSKAEILFHNIMTLFKLVLGLQRLLQREEPSGRKRLQFSERCGIGFLQQCKNKSPITISKVSTVKMVDDRMLFDRQDTTAAVEFLDFPELPQQVIARRYRSVMRHDLRVRVATVDVTREYPTEGGFKGSLRSLLPAVKDNIIKEVCTQEEIDTTWSAKIRVCKLDS